METEFDVVALGELLIDFTQNGMSRQGNPVFEANPGGAPANVLAMLRKLGRTCAFLGKVGRDSFGDLLEQTLTEKGIDTRGLLRAEEVPTTLALVHTLPDGDREFSFYRKPGADLMLRAEELDPALLGKCRVFHFGSLSLTDEPCRSATRRAVELAKAAGAILSFDPNLREPLWTEPEQAREEISWGMSQCDVVKIADNELLFLTDCSEFDRGAALLRERFPNLRLVNVTAGAEGSCAYYQDSRVFVPACALGGVMETTGAGDTFCACVLHFLLEHGLEELTPEQLTEMLRFANAAAYLVTTRKGAINSMPDLEQIEQILRASAHRAEPGGSTR